MSKTTKFYSVVLKKWVNIPNTKVKEVVRNGRKFAVGIYKVGQKEYEAWKVLGAAAVKSTAKKGSVVKKVLGKKKPCKKK